MGITIGRAVTIDIALIVAFIGIVCLLLCSPRRDEMLFRWLPQFVRWVIHRWTGWRLKRYSYRDPQQVPRIWYKWEK